MDKRAKDIIIGSLAVAAAGVSLYLAFGSRSPKIDLDPYEILGAVTAEETANLIGNKGQVLVMVPDSGASKNPSVEAEMSAFQQTLKKHKDVTFTAQKIQITPMLMMATGGGVPAAEFFKALDSHPNVGALVLFFGFPQLGDSELEALKKYGVKMVVVSSFRPAYQQLMEKQAIHLAIVPRPESPPADAKAPKTLRERFDQQFVIIRATDAAKSP